MKNDFGCLEMAEKIEKLGDNFEEISKKAVNQALPTLQDAVTRAYDSLELSERSTGALRKSIASYKARVVKKTGNVKGFVGFKGDDSKERNSNNKTGSKQKEGVRNGLKAGVLEYGKKGQPPRPFLRAAAKQSENEIRTIVEETISEEIEKTLK